MRQQMQQLPEDYKRTQELEEAKKRHKDQAKNQAEEDRQETERLEELKKKKN